MGRKRGLLVLWMVVASLLEGSSSFLMPRSVTHTAFYELALFDWHLYHSKACEGYSCYATPFYAKSTNGSNLARYFFPDGSRTLNIQENGSGNVGSLWLDLIAAPGLSYSSTVSIAPEREASGANIVLRFDGSDVLLSRFLSNPYLSLSFALLKVRTNLHIKEELTGEMAYGQIPGVTTGIEALNNPKWRYGRLSSATQEKWGVDDIQVKVGDNWFFWGGEGHAGLYLVGTIPTGARPQAHLLFEPLVGTTHAALGIGLNADLPLYCSTPWRLHLLGDVKYRYLFSGRERRSFDLRLNGDWSRYLLLVKREATSVPLFGINQMTVPVKVVPGSQVEAWFALHGERCGWNAEVGYNLWYRTKDQQISFLQEFPSNTGIYDLAGVVNHDPVSASQANISETAIPPNIAPSDASFTPSSGFDPSSGSQGTAWTHTLYGALSYNDEEGELPYLFGLGGSYEWAATLGALGGWSLWGSAGFRF